MFVFEQHKYVRLVNQFFLSKTHVNVIYSFRKYKNVLCSCVLMCCVVSLLCGLCQTCYGEDGCPSSVSVLQFVADNRMIMGIIMAGTGDQQLLLELDHSESWSLTCFSLPGWQANN